MKFENIEPGFPACTYQGKDTVSYHPPVKEEGKKKALRQIHNRG